ncbi:MAG: DUF3737 family protein [Atopobiaceae bacterium]|nr:DUF3737 family protein [Atopobiaceae bacterium]
MQTISNEHFTGERALFKAHDLRLNGCTFDDGESPLKESRHITAENVVFGWYYPLWYAHDVRVRNSVVLQDVRAGLWYSNDVVMEDTNYAGVKGIRKCRGVRLERVQLPNAEETLWWCDGVELKDVTVTGDYFCQGSNNIHATGLKLNGKYSFDGCTNVVIEDSQLITKDAFWNCENVVVRNSLIVSQYLSWNARNVRFENCVIKSEQGMCYVDGLTLRDCQLMDTDLAFEYCTNVDAELTAPIVSVKNPLSGRIVAPRIGEVIFDDPVVDATATTIVQTELPSPCLCKVA